MNKTRLSHVSFLVVCALWVQSSLAQAYTPWSLPAEALARLGKASVGAGDQTAASRAGVWLDDTNTSAEIALLTDHMSIVWSVAFSPDGNALATASLDGSVLLWDVESGQRIKTLDYADFVYSVAFSPDGKTLASDTRLWDVASGQRIKTLDYADFVYSVAFSPDGKILASAGEDSTVRLRNVESGQLINRLTGHTGRVLSVAFSPDGKTLASAGEDGNVRLWDMSPYITPSEPTAIQSSAPRLLPAVSGLEPNYPNPFNASTYLIYRLATPGAVRLKIYNTLGQPVRTLVDQYQPAGFYQVAWDGRDQHGAAMAAGVYLTRLFYSGGEQTRRMLLLK